MCTGMLYKGYNPRVLCNTIIYRGRPTHYNTVPLTLTLRVSLYLLKTTPNCFSSNCILIDSVPQVVQVACHHGDALTNKPTKHDDRDDPLIFSLHNTDKASVGPPIG